LQTKEEMLEFLRFVENEYSTAAAKTALIKIPLVRVREADVDLMREVINNVTQPYIPVTNIRGQQVANFDNICASE